MATTIKVPIAALYIDNLVLDDAGIFAIFNTVPEDDEDQVRSTANIALWVATFQDVDALSSVKVWATIGGSRVLIYDMGGGGFQAGFTGTDVLQMSPAAALNDELILDINPDNPFPSHDTIKVEVEAKANTQEATFAYQVTTEYTEAPVVDDILWLTPRKARLRFREAMQNDTELGGIRFMKTLTAAVEVVDYETLAINNLVPQTEWIGYWLGFTGSAHPQDNNYFKIATIDATAKRIVLDTRGRTLAVDDGIDKDDDGNVIRTRTLRATITPYRLESLALGEDEVQCAYEPVVDVLRAPVATEMPLGADPNRYVIISFHDDVSITRPYSLHLANTLNEFKEVSDADSFFNFYAPTFGSPENRISLWELMSLGDRVEDLGHEAELRKMCCVLQDLLNVLWHRCDSLEDINDPDKAPESWVPYLLYSLGNPFDMPLDLLDQRRLASVLITIYKRIGTPKIIEDTLAFFLGGSFVVQPFLSTSWWSLNSSVLGVTTVLGPSSAYARNAYEIISSIPLTTEQRRTVRQIATYLDPVYMHLVRIVEPGELPRTLTYWIMGSSSLGFTTVLAP